MAHSAYSAHQQLPKQVQPVPFQPPQDMIQLVYQALCQFYITNRDLMLKDVFAQVLEGVKAVNGEAPQQILSELSSLQNRTVQLESSMNHGGSSVNKLSSQVKSLSTKIDTLTTANSRVDQDKASSSACCRPELLELLHKIQGLTDLIQPRLHADLQKDQHHDQTMRNLVVEVVARELKRTNGVKDKIRCICGSDQVEPNRPNTRRQKKQVVLLIFCESCKALHHGICVGYPGPASYSCTSGSKATRKPVV